MARPLLRLLLMFLRLLRLLVLLLFVVCLLLRFDRTNKRHVCLVLPTTVSDDANSFEQQREPNGERPTSVCKFLCQ